MYYALAGFFIVMVAAYLRKIKNPYEDFWIGLGMPIFLVVLLATARFTGWLAPNTLDGALRQIDLSIGLDGFAFTRWLFHYHLYFWVSPVYVFLPVTMALAWALERDRLLLRACCIAPLFAFACYLIVPASGPQYAFADFPSAVNHLVPVGYEHCRNCMPSMHVTWALLIALRMRDGRWNWFFQIFAVLTMLATVAGGEHYFIDVIAAIPFTFAIQWLAERSPKWNWVQGLSARGRGEVPRAMSDSKQCAD